MNHKIALISGPVISGFLGIVMIPMMSWFVGVDVVAKFTLIQVFVMFGALFLSLSMFQSLVRFYHENSERYIILFWSSILPSCIFFVLVLFFFLFFELRLTNFVGIPSNISKEISLWLTIFFASSNLILLHLLRMLGRFYHYAVALTGVSFIMLLGVLVAFSFDIEFNTEYLIFLVLFSHFIVFLYHLCASNEIFAVNFLIDIDPVIKLSREMLKFSFPLLFGSVAYWGLNSIDRFFLEYYSTSSQLAILGVSVALASAVNVFTAIFSNIWHPYIYSLKRLSTRKVEFALNLMCAFVMLVWCLVGMFSFVLQYILPAEYSEASNIIILCVAAPLLYLLSEVSGCGIGYRKKTSFNAFAAFIAFSLNLLLNFILIPDYAAVGAVIATTTSFLAFFILKTEFSVFCGYRINRILVYCIISFMFIVSVVINLVDLDIFVQSFIWLIVFITICSFLFKYVKYNFVLALKYIRS